MILNKHDPAADGVRLLCTVFVTECDVRLRPLLSEKTPAGHCGRAIRRQALPAMMI
jgi:hypothetical protein